MSASVYADLAEEFGLYGYSDLDEAVLHQVDNLTIEYNISVEDVVQETIACLSNEKMAEVTEQIVQVLKCKLMKGEKGTKSAGSAKQYQSPTRPLTTRNNQEAELLASYGVIPVTPEAPKPLQKTPDSSIKRKRDSYINSMTTPSKDNVRRTIASPSTPRYTQRKDKLEILHRYGENITWRSTNQEVNMRLVGPGMAPDCKYMLQKVQDRAHVIDRQITRTVELILSQHFPDKDIEFTSVAEKSCVETYIFGQICCDGEGRFNTESVLIQGDMSTSNGRCVSVDISGLQQYSLFPGQVVVLKGQNPNGETFVATQVFAPKVVEADNIEGQGCSIVLACGPFTPDKSDDFLPLSDLVTEANKMQPDVLVLMGPFTDCNNTTLMNSITSYDELFESSQQFIRSNLDESIKVVFISSHCDLHHDNVYPTPPYKYSQAAVNMKYVMDPCNLDIDGIRLSMTSTDVMFNMASNEISSNPDEKDRMLRLSDHILSQRLTFPLYPAAHVNVDLELNEKYGSIPDLAPHVLILPSDLPQFIKTTHNRLIINPGKLCKRQGGGTFLKLCIDSQSANSKLKPSEAVKAQIVRI